MRSGISRCLSVTPAEHSERDLVLDEWHHQDRANAAKLKRGNSQRGTFVIGFELRQIGNMDDRALLHRAGENRCLLRSQRLAGQKLGVSRWCTVVHPAN